MKYAPVFKEKLKQVVFGGHVVRKELACYNVVLKSFNGNYSDEIQVLDQALICGSISRFKNKKMFRNFPNYEYSVDRCIIWTTTNWNTYMFLFRLSAVHQRNASAGVEAICCTE